MSEPLRVAELCLTDCPRDKTTPEHAARFIAELVRCGVTFTAKQDTDHRGVPTMFVYFNGGY